MESTINRQIIGHRSKVKGQNQGNLYWEIVKESFGSYKVKNKS